ncbi:MAG: outer membrane protein assembly factor [Defluviimonas sp.]|nr:outer membrane protein assembly factor [Defluviimonas sp.]
MFEAPAADEVLLKVLRGASLTVQAEADKETSAQSLYAAARADYAKLLGALYAEGYYGGTISIRIDGTEAAGIAALDAPRKIGTIRIRVNPGPQFRFSKARMKPYAPGTRLPPDYGDTKVAKSTAIVAAATAGVEGWRDNGYAKAAVADQSIVADHTTSTLSSQIILAPGPRLRFGALTITGAERMRAKPLRKIAGFPTGEVFDPAKAEKVAQRLRQTGVFRSVALTEAETANPDGTLDYTLALSEEKLHRFGFGGEVASDQGLTVSGYWLHRNLFGGGERLKVDGEINQIGNRSGVIGYSLGARIERPGTPVTDASAFAEVRAERGELFNYRFDSLDATVGLSRMLSDTLSAEAGLSYSLLRADYPFGAYNYQTLSLPISLTWDRRDNLLDPRGGFYLKAGVTPFYGIATAGSGGQFKADARIYRGFGRDDRLVLAGRFQIGTVVGPTLFETPPDLVFFSGGGGTVRGQPYQSLGVRLSTSAGNAISGGQSFIGVSGELRADVTDTIGAVAFYDAGFISAGELMSGNGKWHSGAGVGLRYDTGVGPIRFDIGLPVSGKTGSGPQFYIGIGQAF